MDRKELPVPSERYFRALVKPKKPANDGDFKSKSLIADGSVFSSLPLYRVTMTGSRFKE